LRARHLLPCEQVEMHQAADLEAVRAVLEVEATGRSPVAIED
jgi:hypothetical protein